MLVTVQKRKKEHLNLLASISEILKLYKIIKRRKKQQNNNKLVNVMMKIQI